MPVIGRLDEQVDEILITPLERRRERDTPPAADEPNDPSAPVEAPASETSRPRDELPVWLL